MSNCIIYTFSGTGNSKRVASFVGDNLSKKGIEVTYFNIKYPLEEKDIPDPNNYDYVGFSYPIHGFNSPKPFVKFIKLLPISKSKDKKYFIIKNSGEPFAVNSASSSLTIKILKKKGYVLDLEHHFLMPYNIMFKYPEGMIKQMYLTSKAVGELYANEIVDNHHIFKIKTNPLYKTLAFIIRIEWLAGPINAKLCFVKKKKCVKCYKCIKNCPSGALYLNKKGKIKRKTNCCICMNCSFSCPKDAYFMGILNLWRVNLGGSFPYKKVIEDSNIRSNYVNKNTKGYFKSFRKYYDYQNELLKKNNIEINN